MMKYLAFESDHYRLTGVPLRQMAPDMTIMAKGFLITDIVCIKTNGTKNHLKGRRLLPYRNLLISQNIPSFTSSVIGNGWPILNRMIKPGDAVQVVMDYFFEELAPYCFITVPKDKHPAIGSLYGWYIADDKLENMVQEFSCDLSLTLPQLRTAL